MAKKKLGVSNLEIIYWRDVHGLDTGWLTPENAAKEANKLVSFQLFTVGKVIHEDDVMVVIAASGDVEGQEGDYEATYNDISMIPKSEIISRKKLK